MKFSSIFDHFAWQLAKFRDLIINIYFCCNKKRFRTDICYFPISAVTTIRHVSLPVVNTRNVVTVARRAVTTASHAIATCVMKDAIWSTLHWFIENKQNKFGIPCRFTSDLWSGCMFQMQWDSCLVKLDHFYEWREVLHCILQEMHKSS